MMTATAPHPLTCNCDDCEQLIINQFSAFHSAPFTPSIRYHLAHCPQCQRPTKGRRRRNLQLWTCWECTAQLAIVTRIVNSHVTGQPEFAFAIKEDNVTSVYFHLNRQAHITFDGSDYAQLLEPDGNQTVLTTDVATDDIIIYYEFLGEKGPKALWWAFETEHDKVKQEIANRPLYRLIDIAQRDIIHESKTANDFLQYDLELSYFESFDAATDTWKECEAPVGDY